MNLLSSQGLVLVPAFLSKTEEDKIISNIPPTKATKGSSRNSIRRYGSNIPYKNQMISDTIPEYLDAVALKIVNDGFLTDKPNSISINEYLPGNFIPPHIDSLESGPIITIISLMSDAMMVLAFQEKSHTIVIPARSLLQLRDEMRYKWTHSILPVKDKRYSVVFRNG